MMARDGAWCGSCAGGLGWVMTWRRARMVLLSTQGMDVPAIAKIACAKSKPADHDLPFPVLKLVEAGGVPGRRGGWWSTTSAARACGPAPRGGRQRLKTWKASRDPNYAAKKARVEHLSAIADGEVVPEAGELAMIFCVDEVGPFNPHARPGRPGAAISGKSEEPGRQPRPRTRAAAGRWRGRAKPPERLTARLVRRQA